MEIELPIWWRPSIMTGAMKVPVLKARRASALVFVGVKYLG